MLPALSMDGVKILENVIQKTVLRILSGWDNIDSGTSVTVRQPYDDGIVSCRISKDM